MANNTLQNASALGIDPDQEANESPTEEELKTVAARIKAARSAATDPVDLQKYDDAQDEAKQLYHEQASRSEWLGLADRIGNSLARIGAARAGLATGTDQSHIDTGPQYDAQGATDRAAKDYSTELGKINENRSGALRNQQEDYGLGERALDSLMKDKATKSAEKRADARAEAQAGRDKEAREFTATRDDKRATNSAAAQALLFKQQADLQNNALTQKDKHDKQVEDDKARAAEVKDLDGQLKGAQTQLQARQALFNNLMNDGDVAKKPREKLQAEYGKLAATAGIDLTDIQKQLSEQETTRPGWLGGKTADEEKAAKKIIIDQSLDEAKNLLDGLKQQKAARLKREQAASPSAPPPADDKVVVVKDGKRFNLPKGQLQEALKQGYTLAK